MRFSAERRSPASSILVETLGRRGPRRRRLQAAVDGPESLPAGIPVETVGKWSSVDRSEIEGMRAVRNIMAGYIADYLRGSPLERPLSIAVFGPPGAGKSFAVKQIAKVLLPGRLRDASTFNLSQFRSEDELPAGLPPRARRWCFGRRCRWSSGTSSTRRSAGQPLGWLRYFLAPMQDGEFREDGVFHPIGPAIFVFAGGTSSTLQQFAEVRDEEAEKAAKKPDFLSRLKGYVNVFGPNPLGADDVAFMLRRALLLRGMLGAKAPQLLRKGTLQIDEGLLRAFIAVDRYRNGARSMEAIIDTSALGGKLRYERSSLPPEDQLELQVDARAFLRADGGRVSRPWTRTDAWSASGVTGHRSVRRPRARRAARVRDGAAPRARLLAGDEAPCGAPCASRGRLAARRGRRPPRRPEALALPGTTLVAVLPFPADDYARDFATEEARREFVELLDRVEAVEVMPPAPSREAGYERQGRWVADHSDVLLVVWDGVPSRGRAAPPRSSPTPPTTARPSCGPA